MSLCVSGILTFLQQFYDSFNVIWGLVLAILLPSFGKANFEFVKRTVKLTKPKIFHLSRTFLSGSFWIMYPKSFPWGVRSKLYVRKVRTKRDWPVAFWNFYQVFSVSYSLLSSCLTTISKEFFGQSYFSFHEMIIFLPMSRQNHYCWCQSNNVKWARICMELR